MKYIILDMEWNQPYNAKVTVRENVSLCGEIIQIGAVRLDENFNTIGEFDIMIAPKYYKKMHEYVARITKITTKELQEQGVPFVDAFYKFKSWCGSDFVFLTWGPDDVGILRDNMSAYGIDTDWLPDSYDAQMIFAHQIIKKKQQTSLTAAMEMVGEPALKAHDALNDAKNTAVVCRHLDMTGGIENYTTMMEELMGIKPRDDEDGDVREYNSKKLLFIDTSFTSFACPVCGKTAKCTEIIRQNSEKYISAARCENGHEHFVRFKFKRLSRKKHQVSRMIYDMDEENRAYYMKKKGKKDMKQASGSN